MFGAGIRRGRRRHIEVERIGQSGGDSKCQTDGQCVFDLCPGDAGVEHITHIVYIDRQAPNAAMSLANSSVSTRQQHILHR
jgi:hypothetical protein